MPNDISFKKSSFIMLDGMADRFMEWKCHWNYPAQQFSTVPLEGPDPHGQVVVNSEVCCMFFVSNAQTTKGSKLFYSFINQNVLEIIQLKMPH